MRTSVGRWISRLLSGSKDHRKIFVCDNAVSRMNFPGYFLLGVPEQEHDPAQLPGAGRIGRRSGLRCGISAGACGAGCTSAGGRSPQSLCCCSPSKIAGKRSFWYWQTENRSEILSGWEKSPPPRRSTLYACMLISVNSPSGVSSMQATETRLSVSHTAGTCIPAGLLRWKRRNFILSELRTQRPG